VSRTPPAAEEIVSLARSRALVVPPPLFEREPFVERDPARGFELVALRPRVRFAALPLFVVLLLEARRVPPEALRPEEREAPERPFDERADLAAAEERVLFDSPPLLPALPVAGADPECGARADFCCARAGALLRCVAVAMYITSPSPRWAGICGTSPPCAVTLRLLAGNRRHVAPVGPYEIARL
jgi:hypothetical protein